MKSILEQDDPFETRGPGVRLREAREAAGVSIDKVAISLRLDSATVEALESDAFDKLPAPTFVRGYLRGYARMVGVPSGPILEMYDRHGFEPPALATTIPESQQAHTSDAVVRLATFAVMAVLVVLVGLWWHSQEDGGFGISADLFSWSLDSITDSEFPFGETPETAPVDGESGDESMARATGEPFVLWQGDDAQVPLPAQDAASGEITAAESAPFEPAAGTVLAPETSTAPTSPTETADTGDTAVEAALAAETGSTIETDTTADTASAEGTNTATAESDSTTAVSGSTTAASDSTAETATTSADDATAAARTTVRDDGVADADTAAQTSTGGADRGGASVIDETERTVATSTSSSAEVPAPTAPAEPQPSSSQTTSESSDSGPSAATGTALSGLVLEFVHESWVEVYDRDRTRLFFGLVQPGRVLNLDGAKPFDVLLGFSNDVRVVIDGEVFDHTPYITHGVSRFTVGETPAPVAETAESETTTAPAAQTGESTDTSLDATSGESTAPDTGATADESTDSDTAATTDESTVSDSGAAARNSATIDTGPDP